MRQLRSVAVFHSVLWQRKICARDAPSCPCDTFNAITGLANKLRASRRNEFSWRSPHARPAFGFPDGYRRRHRGHRTGAALPTSGYLHLRKAVDAQVRRGHCFHNLDIEIPVRSASFRNRSVRGRCQLGIARRSRSIICSGRLSGFDHVAHLRFERLHDVDAIVDLQ